MTPASSLSAVTFDDKLRAAFCGLASSFTFRRRSAPGRTHSLQAQTLALTESSADALLFLNPIRDASGEVAAFRIAHANRRAAALLATRPEMLAGRDLVAVLPFLAGADVLRQYRSILQTGEPQTATLAVDEPGLSAEWLRVSAARFEHGLLLTLCDLTEDRAREHELNQQVQRDPLTGLANRTLLDDRLQQALKRARRNNQAAAVLLLDLDGFRQINEEYGRAAGDHVLKSVATRLTEAVRSTDSVVRLGGDEFVIIFGDVFTHGPVTDFARRIVLSMFAPIIWNGRELQVTASIGVALYPAAGSTPETLLVQADIEMNRMKRAHCSSSSSAKAQAPMDSRTFAVSLP